MSLTRFTGNTNVISQLADTPALTATEIKAKFDETDNIEKNYINETLIPEIEQLVATEKATLQGNILNTRAELNESISSLDASALKFIVIEEWEEEE